MLILLWAVTVVSIAGSAMVLSAERVTAGWTEAVPPWADAIPNSELQFDGGFGGRS